MSTTTANLGLFKYNTTTDANVSFNINTALNDNWDKIDAAVTGGSSRNIGEIVASTIPLTDAGLHLLDGSLIQGSGIYSAFVTYIAGLDLTANYFCTEAEWQQSITQYGVCGKFVYDSTNNTVRLPKITGIVEGTTDLTALGDLVEAGLPMPPSHYHFIINGDSGSAVNPGNVSNTNYLSRDAYTGSWVESYRLRGTSTVAHLGKTSNPTYSSSSIYGNSTTVQPQAIKAFYYIVIATSTKTDIQVDIDTIATDLNSKVSTGDLAEVQCVVETYQNGMSWYRVYSDGWCEQGITINVSAGATYTWTFLKPYISIYYQVFTQDTDTLNTTSTFFKVSNKATGSVQMKCIYTSGNITGQFYACGYIM